MASKVLTEPSAGHITLGTLQSSAVPLSPVIPATTPDASKASSQPPPTAASAVETWKSPRRNSFRLAVIFLAFFNLGLNDASYGALLPSLTSYYTLTYLIVSLVFLTPFFGYASAALLNDKMHMLIGQRGIAIAAPAVRIIAYIVLSIHPPYPVILVLLAFAGFGIGLLDAAWNAWVGSLANANELLGFVHGMYGLGATVAPLISASFINTYHLPWWTFYYLMISLTALEMVLSTWAFWEESGRKFREANLTTSNGEGETGAARTKAVLGFKVTWITSAFLLAYVGTEVSLGGWLVTFMLTNRAGTPFSSSLTATGFWLGITVGRFVLGFLTSRLGERWSVASYLVLAMALELVFWLVPEFTVSAVAISFVGFCLGPMFPAAIVAISKLLPKRYHVGTIGFAAAVGGGGAAVLPFLVGILAEAKGPGTLQPVGFSLLAVLLGVWLTLPRIPKGASAHVD